ncbi:MAG: DUF1002 domain-containing protein [Oscillospiraceae bacterium]|nr:DUF1002 domain-containing protein [Oscillospiraceae bacterium]
MKKMIGLFSALLCALLLCTAAYADSISSCAVIGADLDDEQAAQMYEQFGIERGSVLEVRLTNADERSYLEGMVDEALLGTRSISCVYIELLSEGSGIQVDTYNVTWCTPEMYSAALVTAGITDARVVVASPFEVSGTSALAGMYRAYQELTGGALDDTATMVGVEELTITGELAEAIGSADSEAIVGDLKQILTETVNMTDEELSSEIHAIAKQYNVNLTDGQVKRLVNLCRSLEGLNIGQLTERVQNMQNTIKKVSEAKDEAAGFLESLKNVLSSVSDFFNRISAMFGK